MVAVMNEKPTPPLSKDVTGYTLQEVADLLGLKLYTVQRLVREKAIRSIRHGGTERMPRNLRVTRAALDEYLLSLHPTPGEGGEA